jgi:heparan-alpha-glucosaminide N-acetyltransferase
VVDSQAMSAAKAAALPERERTFDKPATGRYLPLDAFRGFIMVLLVSHGFGFRAVGDVPVYRAIGAWFDHVPWEGGVFWDMIQPAFMFMVGVAMPFALARRAAQGATFRDNFRHVAIRSLKLILLSQILISIGAGKPGFQLINVLAQMAFTYFFCFLIMQWKFRTQAVAAGLILAAHWALFLLFPGPDGAFSKTDNIGAVIDRALGLHYSGYYVTINFVSSTVTTLFGVWTGLLLMSARPRREQMKILAYAMIAAFASGLALGQVNPLVKRIWTASFTLYSTGWVLFMLLGFYWLVEVRGYRKLVFPLLVVGMNSIFVYSLNQVLWGWIDRAAGVFTGRFTWLGTPAPVLQACAVLGVMWYLCYWLYQRKIFLKL